MTDLERARAHLLHSQAVLAVHRRMNKRFLSVSWAENCVLAALSWVWEEQVKSCGCGHCAGECYEYSE